MSQSWDRIFELLHAALELPEAARAAFVDTHDPVIATELRSLLAAHASADNPLDRAPVVNADDALAAGSVLGRYRILKEIGRGGMGRVYLVERSDGEYEKHGALKLLDALHSNAALIDSFLRERQILARLEHPHIARLLDGGRSAQGLPYLVMEYVQGMPIDRFCVEGKLDLTATLALFIKVCEAVDFAHRHLVVHADIKPGNVLVGRNSEPVLLDFGIARNLAASAEAGHVPALTPAYAAPEQLEGEVVGVAADVYALGVLLFELLTGARPNASAGLGPRELASRIRSQPPPRLRDHVPRAGLPARLPSELDWICAHALQPRPENRFPGAAALAADVRALLAHQPISLRAGAVPYRLRKLLRRRWPWAIAAVLLLGLSSAFVWRLDTERRRTRDALAATQVERDRAEGVVAFLSELFREADTTQAGGRVVSARELLDRGRSQLAARTDLPPVGRALLQNALAEVYRNMGLGAVALELLEDARTLVVELDSPALEARTLTNLGTVYELAGRHQEARTVLTRALTLRRAEGDPVAIADAAEALAVSLQSLGDKTAAGALFRELYALRASTGADANRRADAALRLGSWHWVAGELDVAARHYQEALAIRRGEVPANLPELARTLDAFAALKHAQGRYGEAPPLYRDALELRRRVLGDRHRHTADTLSNLGAALFDAGDNAAAETALREALAIFGEVLPADSPVLAKSLNNLGLVRHRQRQHDEARALFERALEINRRAYGNDHARVAGNLNNLGLVLEEQDQLDAAAGAYSQALAIFESSLGATHPQLAYSLTNLARVRFWQQRDGEARELFERALAIRTALDANHPAQAETLAWYGFMQCRGGADSLRGKSASAGIEMLERARTIAEAHGLERSPAPEARAMLGLCLQGTPRAVEGAELIAAARPGLIAQRGDNDRLVRALVEE